MFIIKYVWCVHQIKYWYFQVNSKHHTDANKSTNTSIVQYNFLSSFNGTSIFAHTTKSLKSVTFYSVQFKITLIEFSKWSNLMIYFYLYVTFSPQINTSFCLCSSSIQRIYFWENEFLRSSWVSKVNAIHFIS